MKPAPPPAPAWRSSSLSIRIGISACLLGEPVRYDGGHKKDGYITGTLARHFDWVAAGFFKDRLDAAEKRELGGLIADFAAGLVPLVVPITLINHFVARHELTYIADQIYLRPHPRELMLRNHT